MGALYRYFQENWERNPFPVIDHSIRIQKELDGSFTFYIHPSNVGGNTLDFVCTEEDLKLRKF